MDAKMGVEQDEKRTPVRHLLVDEEWAGSRLERFVSSFSPGVPKSAVNRWLRTGQVRVDGGRKRGDYRLSMGEKVRLPPAILEEEGRPQALPTAVIHALGERIIFRDGSLLVVDKPAGIPVHGGSGHALGVVDGVRQLLAGEGGSTRPELCHRLDRETSGVLIFALTRQAVRTVAESFRKGQVEKHYLTLVMGAPARRQGRIDTPLVKGVVQGGERMVVAQAGGETALTRYRVVTHLEGASLLEVMPESGRTHQIRVHLQSIGYPVAGDDKYGDRDFNRRLRHLGLNRLFLHAARLVLPHPVTGRPLDLTSALPPPLPRVLKQLGWEEE